MPEEGEILANPQDALKLKLPEPEVSGGKPWDDDVLGRTETAGKLTNIIRNQSAPFTLSIHGDWGTGKTFLLKRWQQDLVNQQFKAIYFNAWEDDFCDDPLLAILGQLSNYFKKSKLEEIADKVAQSAVPLIIQNTLGILEKHTGINPVLNEPQQGPLERYRSQRVSKDELKRQLTEMSEKVTDETGHPLVFIIDELDRCRPTFAIELLERVKHIFDVPNLVFVFGINRDELSKSLQSIYGEIASDVYLRRFFDMELTLPEADSANFCRHLMGKFDLPNIFDILSKSQNHAGLLYDVQNYINYFPTLWAHLGLSLRDVDYCVRSIALVGRNMKPRSYTYPWLLALLIPLKLKNPTLYRQFVRHDCHASKVIDYIDETLTARELLDGQLLHALNVIEANFYSVEAEDGRSGYGRPTALQQLDLLAKEEALTHPEYLSKRTRQSDKQRTDGLLEMAKEAYKYSPAHNAIGRVAELIDLNQSLIRR